MNLFKYEWYLQHFNKFFDPIPFFTLIYDCGVVIRIFWRRKKFDVGGGKCEVDAPQSNKCEFDHSGHINSNLRCFCLKRKIQKNDNHKIFGHFREAFEKFLSLSSNFINDDVPVLLRYEILSEVVVSQKPAWQTDWKIFKKAKKRPWILCMVQYSN